MMLASRIVGSLAAIFLGLWAAGAVAEASPFVLPYHLDIPITIFGILGGIFVGVGGLFALIFAVAEAFE